MKICLLEDSLPFDGLTPDQRPLGGFQRAVAGLAAALARRRHSVTVINQASLERWVDGVRWLPFGDALAEQYDLLIACGKPTLLDGQSGRINATQRVLWSVADPATLLVADNAQALRERAVDLWFLSAMQAGRYQGRQTVRVISPGVSACYRPKAEPSDLPPPVAVVTAHPDHRLFSLVELWLDKVAPAVPGAELHLYSSLLSRPLRAAGDVPDAYQDLYQLVMASQAMGVHIKAPLPDHGMAQVYQQARVHLHPGHGEDFAVWTLYDSQACGLPAVARMVGGTMDCVANGQTGYLVPDDEAMVNVAVQILSDEAVYRRLSEAAADVGRRRPWDMVARDVERLWTVAEPVVNPVDQAIAAEDTLNDPRRTLADADGQPESSASATPDEAQS